ncbi:MFS transporter [Pedobacter arcticus]|uniref:MFS transporter n=1 Tax=Pedobacter arcticus TaxID=752140 RepID=UPI0003123CA8|nr:MFS transporter [Pedobacter arcticus]
MKRNNLLVGIILLIWFVISFVTNILGPLMPIIIETYSLSLTLAAFLPFSFFLAYGVMSIPAGIIIEKLGEKKAMLIAFSLNLLGSIAFAIYPEYLVALASLFTIGIGMAMLQVIINPLMRTAGGEENFAFFSVLAQLVFGLASFLSPFAFSYLIGAFSGGNENNILFTFFSNMVVNGLNWTILYWIFSFIFLLIIGILLLIKIPTVHLKDDEKTGTKEVYLNLLKDKQIILFFFGIVAYVGTEQALANWMSEFLKTYHAVNPAVEGAKTVAWFWGLMSLGCFLGLGLLKIWDSKIILKTAVLLTVITISFALFGGKETSLYAFPISGFCISVMFSIVFSLALNSYEEHHGSFSGILCSGIFGGALVPFIIGFFGDFIGLRYALMFLYITLGYIWYLAGYAKPLVANKTIALKEIYNSNK